MPILYSTSSIELLIDYAKELSEAIADDPTWQVITPNRSAANTLEVKEYSLQHLAQEAFRTSQVKIAPPLVSHRYLQKALQQTLAPSDAEGMAKVWLPSIQEMLHAQSVLPKPQRLSERGSQVLKVAHKYQQLLREEGWIDSSEIFWQAIEQNSPKRSLVIYGYFDPKVDELAFIEAIADQNSIFYLLDEDHRVFTAQKQLREYLKQRGWTAKRLPSECSTMVSTPTPSESLSRSFLSSTPNSHPQSIVAQVYTHPEAEARGVLAQVKQLLAQGVLSNEIIIVAINDTDWGDRLADIAWEYDIALRLPYKIPIADTRVGAWIKLLLEVLEQRWPFELTTRFLRHPLSRELGKNIWEKLSESKPTNFDAWRSLILTEKAIDFTPLELPLQASRSNWLLQFQKIFELFKLRQQARPWAKESLAYKNLIEGLDDVRFLGDETLTWAQFREEMLTSLNLITTIAAPGREGVELHNPLSIAGARYDYVFVIDGREGNLPKPIANDSVVDFYERKQLKAQGLNLATAAELAQREIFAFYTLLQVPQKQFTFSYAKIFPHQGYYAQSAPSSHFQRLGLEPVSVSLEVIPSPEIARQLYLRQSEIWDEQVLQGAIQAWNIEKQRESSEPPNEFDGVVGIPFAYEKHWFSASQLTQLGQCPFKWFANKLLKLEELEEIEEELSHSLKGKLYHKVLEIALGAFQKDPQIDLTNDENLQDWFIQAEKDVAQKEQVDWLKFSAWQIQRQEHINTLRQVMEKDEFLPESTEILTLETHFQGELNGLKIQGYVDRIDHRENGLVLIDYKSGGTIPNGIKDHENKAKIDLQLPIYQAVGAAYLYPGEPVQKTIYYSLSKRKDILPQKVITEVELIEILDGLKAHFYEGSYPVAPDQEKEACKYCSNELVCRQGDRLQRKGV